MKKLSIFIIAVTFMAAFLAGPLNAQQTKTEQQQATGQQMDQQNPLQAAGMHKASDLMGKTISTQQGEEIGNINDLVVGDQGRVQYIILSRGEILGMGGEMVPVPWEAANLQMQQDNLVTSLDKQKFQDAPSFKGDQWAKFSEPGYEQEVHSYFGTQPQEGFREAPGATTGTEPDVMDKPAPGDVQKEGVQRKPWVNDQQQDTKSAPGTTPGTQEDQLGRPAPGDVHREGLQRRPWVDTPREQQEKQ